MRRTRLAVATFLMLFSTFTLADDFSCPPNMTGVIPGNVVVPPGLECVLSGATVLGNVTAHLGSRVDVTANSTVRGNVTGLQDTRVFVTLSSTVEGNVEGHNASAVQVIDSTVLENVFIEEAHDPIFLSAAVVRSTVVNGDVHMLRGVFPLGDWTVFQSRVLNGNVIAEDNASTFLSRVAQNPLIAGNVQVYKNKGSAQKNVRLNTVTQDVQCFENDPPFLGFPNVARKAEGQCGLTGLPAASAEEPDELPPPDSDGLYRKTPN